jgi:SAM-dependent methyltransferase
MKPPEVLQDADYNRQRTDPRPGDMFYLALADLRKAVELMRQVPASRILDFGSGGSPYRALFSAKTYDRADLPGDPTLDFEFGMDSILPIQDEKYDLVLSTQVLEHVKNVAAYLAEAKRVLQPGGRLFITTHGTYPDHACPHDYQRWTHDGLRHEVEDAGFLVNHTYKLSTGPRALMFLMSQHHQELLASGWSAGSLMLKILRAPFRWWRPGFERFLDRNFDRCRLVNANEDSSPLYIGLVIDATKPH